MFRFDVSDESATEKKNEVPLDGPDVVALPAKEIHASKELWNSVNTQKTKQYALSCGKVLTSICSTDVEHDIRHAAAHSDSAIAQALSADIDLLPHIYEGGLKVWECSLDLTEYLSTQHLKLDGLKVLELGCGTGLPGLYALTEKAATVHFQDYNEEVVRRLTIPNVVLNSDETRLNDCRFFSGDWESLEKLLFQPTEENADVRYDMILTSETIYSPASYKKLHNVMASLLRPNGVIYLAAKTCYFGVGGGAREFEEYVRMEGVFDLIVVKELDNGVQREILKLTLKQTV